MTPFEPRWFRRMAMALAVFVAAAGTQSTGQAPAGAAARPPAVQEPPLMVMSPKAKSAGWTGVHRPHTKLSDVLARHRAIYEAIVARDADAASAAMQAHMEMVLRQFEQRRERMASAAGRRTEESL